MLKPKIAPHIVEIVKEIQDAGFEAYIVGGAVRDFLLNRQPKDYDLSCSATPEQVRRVFKRRRTLIIGKRFRLVHLFHNREIIEISTFRRRPVDGAGKRPGDKHAPENMIFRDNEYGCAEEDALRRDFTVNAVFYDPVHDKLIDFTGQGLDDIHGSVVRTIGEPQLRFEEDPVRVLRALKLVGQYGFTMEPETKAAVEASLDLIMHVSNSRLTLEFEKILKSPYGDLILDAFHKHGFLRRFLPVLDANWNTAQGRYMRRLWRRRNERVLAKQYRDSISLVMSLLALPFLEKDFGDASQGGLWEYRPGMEYGFKDAIGALIEPRAPTRRAIAASIRTLLLQPRLKKASSCKKTQRHPGYPHARELAIIQNEVLWKIPGFEELWPAPQHHSSDSAPFRGGRRRPPRGDGRDGRDGGRRRRDDGRDFRDRKPHPSDPLISGEDEAFLMEGMPEEEPSNYVEDEAGRDNRPQEEQRRVDEGL